MLEAYRIAIAAAIVGYVYAVILVQPEHILGPFFTWLKKLLTTTKTVIVERELPEELQRLRNQKTEKITRQEVKVSKWLKPFGDCELCTAGQLSLWLFLWRNRVLLSSLTDFSNTFDLVIQLIFTICLTILLTRILYLLIQALSRM